MPKNNDIVMMTVKDVARCSQVNERTVRNWYTKNGLIARKAGGRNNRRRLHSSTTATCSGRSPGRILSTPRGLRRRLPARREDPRMTDDAGSFRGRPLRTMQGSESNRSETIPIEQIVVDETRRPIDEALQRCL
jgi:hypothetical protein